MNKFVRAITYNDERTENDMPTHSTSSAYLVDLFFKMGAARLQPENVLIDWFQKSLSEEELLTIRAMFYNRDCRGGQGERRSFQVFYSYLIKVKPEIATRCLRFIPEFGRWDDVWKITFGTSLENLGFDFILSALKRGDKLCAKWMPREGKKYQEIATAFRKYTGLSRRDYRKLLSLNTAVVENLMCKNQWGEINYNHVPSKASHNYAKAFGRHDNARYVEWLLSLAKPESGNKIHADVILPHEVIMPFLVGYRHEIQREVSLNVEAQWRALPDYVGEGVSFMPICDVSGSMTSQGGLPMAVSVALGIYLSERNKSIFKDGFITFSTRPELVILRGETLREKVNQLSTADWAGSTDLEAVFRLILRKAREANLSDEDMPNTLIILSDMQFNECVTSPRDNAFQMISREYESYGYTMPNVVFWNLRTSLGVPVKFDQHGTALVGGFSPSIFKNILAGEMSPIKMVLKTLNAERYSVIQ